MTTDALDIHAASLYEQLSSNGVFTETAIYDPDGVATEISGVFDENVFRSSDGGGNTTQRKDGARFIVAQITFDFDVYSDKELFFPYRGETFKIQNIEPDKNGATVKWLV